jgi:hypothetical protein
MCAEDFMQQRFTRKLNVGNCACVVRSLFKIKKEKQPIYGAFR